MSTSAPRIAFVIPCYNEEEALHVTADVLRKKVQTLSAKHAISASSSIIFVDDGSADATWREIEQLHQQEPELFHGVKLAHNRGHQNALFAGLMHALDIQVDAAISMDADLQDDPNAADEMIERFRQGAEIVYGVRDSRETDTAFKRNTAHAFYSVMRWMGTETIPDHADYRLMGASALRALAEYGETNLFLRGIVPSLGFNTDKVYYKRGVRVAGESKYPLKKMIAFAIEGITSFSVKPLSMITGLGVLSVIVGIAMLIYTFVSVFSGHAVAGWGSVMCSLWLLGGMILVALGVVGEYIGKIYMEVKHRPRFIIEKTV
ncbi:glycosyltransferase family 2 protein [Bifidobacterium miconisargentati]|uniref:glycosyltransferase family 2 protein n=1 Tax=Bifidobacterium miconisargentati TaxID=2834437 RepID=UPI001BDC0D69|nr:glycosyltransferase family 2 protein [Bifidobacterium miconisargentati]MBW3091181.1 glycosyltransferase family 2 protein [Bifidobacterium miconisargentati]